MEIRGLLNKFDIFIVFMKVIVKRFYIYMFKIDMIVKMIEYLIGIVFIYV